MSITSDPTISSQLIALCLCAHDCYQSELPWPIPWLSMESELGCTDKIYFDKVTLTPKKPRQHNKKCDCSKTNEYK